MDGKTFNPKPEKGKEKETYSKIIFAKKVVKANADTVDFSGFTDLLKRIEGVLKAYEARPAESDTP